MQYYQDVNCCSNKTNKKKTDEKNKTPNTLFFIRIRVKPVDSQLDCIIAMLPKNLAFLTRLRPAGSKNQNQCVRLDFDDF
jgi:hypothetical protein